MFGIFLIFVVQSFATGYLPQSRPLAGLKTPPPGHEAAEREVQRTIVSPKPLFLMSFYKKVFNEKNGVWYPCKRRRHIHIRSILQKSSPGISL